MIKLTELLDESDASEEAEKLGLDYMSFGRWGKDGTVTHTSQNGKLVALEPIDTPDKNEPSIKKPFTDWDSVVKNKKVANRLKHIDQTGHWDDEPESQQSRIDQLEKAKAAIEFDIKTHQGRRDWGRASKRSYAKLDKINQELNKLKGIKPKTYDPIGTFSDEPKSVWGSKSPNINKLSSMTPDDERDVALEKAVDSAMYDVERAQERYDNASRNYELDDNPSNELELEQELIDARDELEAATEKYDTVKREWERFVDTMF